MTTSDRWHVAAIACAVVPSALLGSRSPGVVGAWIFYGVLALAPAAALAARARPAAYRRALGIVLVIFAVAFVLGGIIIAVLYSPAVAFMIAAWAASRAATPPDDERRNREIRWR